MWVQWSRRRFLKGVGAAVGAFLLSKFRQPTTPMPATTVEAGEGDLYGGFVILAEGTPPPPSVHYPSGPPVIMELLGNGPRPTVATTKFSSPEEMAVGVSFPVYTLGNLPPGAQPSGASLVRFLSGQVYSASVGFKTYNLEHDLWEGTISVVTKPYSPTPFPMWAESVPPGGPVIWPTKLTLLGRPALMTRTVRGYVFHWTEKGAYYYLRVENDASLDEALALANSLKRVN